MSEPNVSEQQTAQAASKPPVWVWIVAAALLVIGVFSLVSAAHSRAAEPVVADEADLEPPVIQGVSDIVVTQGDSVSYRQGVAAEDQVDGVVAFHVDASGVNLNVPGEYTVYYSAQDKSGNTATVSALVTVLPSPEVEDGTDATVPDGETSEETPADVGEQPTNASSKALANVTQADVEALADSILAKLVTPNMSKRDVALAIFRYVAGNIKYVGSSDKSSWVVGAYVGFTQKRGDCFNYFACSKVLLTRAGIPNVDLTRVGGTSRHYWQLVDVGKGYYHFDACPHPSRFPLNSFLISEQEAQSYTARCTVRTNYYVYDYDACPVTVVNTPARNTTPVTPPADTTPAPTEETPAEDATPTEGETVAPPEEATPVEGETETTEPVGGETETPQPVEGESEIQPENPEAPPEEQSEPQSDANGDAAQTGNGEQTPASGDEPAPQPEPEAPAAEDSTAGETAP